MAVYSDQDVNDVHVRMADFAVHIGAPHARESYLNMNRILDACISSGAQAVHPGKVIMLIVRIRIFIRKSKICGPAPTTRNRVYWTQWEKYGTHE